MNVIRTLLSGAWLAVVMALSSVSVSAEDILPETQEQAQSFEQLLATLPKSSFSEKQITLEIIAKTGHEKALPFLIDLLSGDVFYVKKTKQLVTRESTESKKFLAKDYLTTQEVGEFKKRKLKKVRINNKLRGQLKSLISKLEIYSEDESIREAAALGLLKSADTNSLDLIQQAAEKEQSESIKQILMTAQSLIQLQSANEAERLLAIENLDRSLYPEVRNGLTALIEKAKSTPGEYTNKEIELAEKTLDSIEQLTKLNSILENVYFGIALGAVLLLAAIGLAITFGVMGVINMAHGEMIMLGAYTTFVIQQLMPNNIGMSLVVAIPAAFLVSGLVGVLIERSVIRHLYGRPLETLLATFGISLILQQAVRSIFGPLNQNVVTPDWMAGTFTVNAGLELTFNRLYIIIFSLLVLAALALVLKKTLFGLQMRAVTMNRPMASSMGIRTGWVDALTFGLGSGIAGVAGVALSQLTNVGPNLGQAYIIDSFMVVVFGGVGNLWGTLVGAMSLGIANKVFEPMAGAVLAKIIVLVAIILFIQKRPRGLFALKGRAVED